MMLPMASVLAELAIDVPGDVLELLGLCARLEAEIDGGVPFGPDLRELAPAVLQEVLLDPVLPADRLQDADRPLRLDDARRDLRDDLLVAAPGAGGGERRERRGGVGRRVGLEDRRRRPGGCDLGLPSRRSPFALSGFSALLLRLVALVALFAFVAALRPLRALFGQDCRSAIRSNCATRRPLFRSPRSIASAPSASMSEPTNSPRALTSTDAVHAGDDANEALRRRPIPLVQTSTYTFESTATSCLHAR